ncbi:ComF family protein [Azomonas macrocytogenes]|uniref:ComF family protein n=1 Tax=Azomonas macrocytogenes TaxID=69962 RepID=A0A839T1E4_AZOMA|nr:ComF family protein [Azomonas macrocytogenes]MBB3102928.1 ComF family protein [Azomonas macrocytogenes]
MVYKWLKKEQTCLLCDEPSDSQPICSACELELPWLGAHCRICALPLPVTGQICGECLKRLPTFDHVQAPWRFAFPVDSLIGRFKHRADWPSGRILAEQLQQHLEHAYGEGLTRPEMLLPVPLSRQRLRQRGFNQAGMLADWLARMLGIPCNPHLLRRTRETPAQQQLDAVARRRNLRQVFALLPGHTLENRHIAVVDDVLTTGATAEAIARVLKQAGAQRVDVYCLARTPKPGD